MGAKKTSVWSDLYNATVKPVADAWDETMRDPMDNSKTAEQQANLDRRAPKASNIKKYGFDKLSEK